MIEQIFDTGAFRITQGEPRCYMNISGGSGKAVYVHFCGTKTHLNFRTQTRPSGRVYPGRFGLSPANTRFIFPGNATHGTLVPPGFRTFARHAATADGTPLDPTVPGDILHVR